jgi:hypothetical protein
MLNIDMRDLSERQLREIVANHCSLCGVTAVSMFKVVAPDDGSAYGAAALRVSTSGDAEILARQLGGSHCGCNVIVTLLQKGRSLAYASRRHHFFHASAYTMRQEAAALDGEDPDAAQRHLA